MFDCCIPFPKRPATFVGARTRMEHGTHIPAAAYDTFAVVRAATHPLCTCSAPSSSPGTGRRTKDSVAATIGTARRQPHQQHRQGGPSRAGEHPEHLGSWLLTPRRRARRLGSRRGLPRAAAPAPRNRLLVHCGSPRLRPDLDSLDGRSADPRSGSAERPSRRCGTGQAGHQGTVGTVRARTTGQPQAPLTDVVRVPARRPSVGTPRRTLLARYSRLCLRRAG